MTKALISIDYTFDFVADEGKLLQELLHKPFLRALPGDPVALIKCYIFLLLIAHEGNDPFHSRKQAFPPHNYHWDQWAGLVRPLS